MFQGALRYICVSLEEHMPYLQFWKNHTSEVTVYKSTPIPSAVNMGKLYAVVSISRL